MYLIHDNGSLPFLVNVDGRRVEIFDNPLDNPVTPPLHKSVVNPEKLEPIGDPVKSYNAKKQPYLLVKYQPLTLNMVLSSLNY